MAVIFREVLSNPKLHGVALQRTVIYNQAFECVVTFRDRISDHGSAPAKLEWRYDASLDWTAITLLLILQELSVYCNGNVLEMKVTANYIVLVFRNTSLLRPHNFCFFHI